ncbi:MAG: sugar phosphate isomerase/epimerase [Clostridia bacterium]|nr:sugar phosphate isomerase/epimerase [Clostridia bacterium]
MKLGVFTTLLSDVPFEEALKYFKSLGIEMIEIGCGGFPGNAHANPDILLNDEAKLDEFKALIAKYGLEISALSCHGNPVHPDKAIAAAFDKSIKDTILLAEKLGIHQINTFSGCPGDCENSKYPNRVVCPWPDDFGEILKWQWEEKLIPYWKDTVAFAKAHGVDKIALELHPGFCVYNTDSLMKLRNAVGPEIGANFDPSHLIWQGMDPVACIKEMGDAIFHFHAKDTKIDKYNTAVNGVLDTKSYGEVDKRSWVFRTVGYGNDYSYWKDMISALRTVGYDYAISIEHEDSLMSQNEGLSKAVSFLKEVLVTEPVGEAWWF